MTQNYVMMYEKKPGKGRKVTFQQDPMYREEFFLKNVVSIAQGCPPNVSKRSEIVFFCLGCM